MHDRFKLFFDNLDLGGLYPIPEWVMDFYVVENAITAGYYHQRNIARIESQAADILDASVTAQHPIVRSNTGVRMMTLSFEYQAYLFAFRRTFEYLAAGILGAFGLPAPRHIRDTARDLAGGAPKYVQWVNPMQSEVVKVARQFKDVLAEHSPRNRTATSAQSKRERSGSGSSRANNRASA